MVPLSPLEWVEPKEASWDTVPGWALGLAAQFSIHSSDGKLGLSVAESVFLPVLKRR